MPEGGKGFMDELMICVAPYPSEHQPEKFEGKIDVPEEALRSYNEGASILHLHVRDEEGIQTMDPSFFERDIKKILSGCPIIIEGSTGGGPEHTLEQRCISFRVPGIEMGSLNLGSINMHGGVYRNPMGDMRFYAKELKARNIKPFLIVFDLSMFQNAKRLEKEGLLAPPHVYNFVLDVPDGLPFSKKNLEIFIDQLPKRAYWFLTRYHSNGWKDFREALERGGHVRVGYEDSPFLASGKKAKSNADLVKEIAKAAKAIGRKVIGPERARKLMGMKGREG